MRRHIKPVKKGKKMTTGNIVDTENVEMQAEDNINEPSLVDLAIDKSPIDFGEKFHTGMLARIQTMLDDYRADLGKNLFNNIPEVIIDDKDEE